MSATAEQRQRYSAALLWLLAGLTLAWGFNWTAMKVALSEIPPLLFRSLCLGFGSAVLFGMLRVGGQPLAVPKGQWGRLILLAIFNVTGWNVLVAFGVTMIASGRAAILAFTMPAWATALAVWLLGEHLSGRKLTGLLLGMAGIALLLGQGAVDLKAAPLGAMLVLGGALSWALGTVLLKRYPVNMPVAACTAWIMLLGSVPIVIGALLFEDPRALAGVTLWPALAVLYNVLVAFAFAQWAWLKLASLLPVSVSTLSTLMIPVVGVLCGMLFLGERPGWTEFAALALVFGSLLTVMLPQQRV
ncbi:MAG TPA: EamA family transporter [Burkholderiales bacterium]|nr:EamA family transporter [Burkholderiales bacterium]